MLAARTPDRTAGYTLLELLVVLAMIGFVAALAAPLAGNAVASATLNADARSLATYLRSEQQIARSEQRVVGIGNGADARALLERSAGLSPQAQLTIADAPLEFFADGTASGGRVTLREDGRTKTVAVAWLTGAIAIEDAP
jgi:general secretion pathway protein H